MLYMALKNMNNPLATLLPLKVLQSVGYSSRNYIPPCTLNSLHSINTCFTLLKLLLQKWHGARPCQPLTLDDREKTLHILSLVLSALPAAFHLPSFSPWRRVTFHFLEFKPSSVPFLTPHRFHLLSLLPIIIVIRYCIQFGIHLVTCLAAASALSFPIIVASPGSQQISTT